LVGLAPPPSAGAPPADLGLAGLERCLRDRELGPDVRRGLRQVLGGVAARPARHAVGHDLAERKRPCRLFGRQLHALPGGELGQRCVDVPAPAVSITGAGGGLRVRRADHQQDERCGRGQDARDDLRREQQNPDRDGAGDGDGGPHPFGDRGLGLEDGGLLRRLLGPLAGFPGLLVGRLLWLALALIPELLDRVLDAIEKLFRQGDRVRLVVLVLL
jgi:hypothetical protein